MNASGFANPVFVALDMPSADRALTLARSLSGVVGGLKIGLEFIAANGPEGVRRIVDLGLPVFADVKFHDIPNTVAGAVRQIANLGIAILNVHASGGVSMMRAAAEAAASASPRPSVIAVTVLTSLDAGALADVGQGDDPQLQAHRLAKLAHTAGLDGVVCSPQEAGIIRVACPRPFLIVTPGVRPSGTDIGDQKRVTTPAQALAEGADILVIGRPITGASDPVAAARAIVAELAPVNRQAGT